MWRRVRLSTNSELLYSMLYTIRRRPFPCHLDRCADEHEHAAAESSVKVQVRPVDVLVRSPKLSLG